MTIIYRDEIGYVMLTGIKDVIRDGVTAVAIMEDYTEKTLNFYEIQSIASDDK